MIAKTCGCSRKIWNLMLADKEEYYSANKAMLSITPAAYKAEYPYLKEVDSLALCNAQLNLDKAYGNFFDGRCGFPKFKKKRHDISYTTNFVNGNIAIFEKGIKLPKLGIVRAVIHRPPLGKLKSVMVSKDAAGRYFASVLFEYEADIEYTDIRTHIGLDYKSDGLYVASDGSCPQMPHYYRQTEDKLSRAQRRLSRKKKGSANYEKQRIKVARLHARAADQRKDFLHKLSSGITNRYDLISVEDLDMKAISGSLHLGKSTFDNGYGMFRNMLEYKQNDKGHYYVEIDKWYPSSQLCHECGYKNSATKNLSVRKILCPCCGTVYDRDLNAAMNIDRAGTARIYACGHHLVMGETGSLAI